MDADRRSLSASVRVHLRFNFFLSASTRLCGRIRIQQSREARADVETAVAAVARGDGAEGAGEVERAGADAHGVGRARAEGDGAAEGAAMLGKVQHRNFELLVALD